MQEACEAVQLKWVLRRGLAILNTLEVTNTLLQQSSETSSNTCHSLNSHAMQIEDNSEHFQTNIKAGGIMDVVERYPWSGQEKQHARRDKRGGHHFGKIVQTDKGPSIQCAFFEQLHDTMHAASCSSYRQQSICVLVVQAVADTIAHAGFDGMTHLVECAMTPSACPRMDNL